jgi:hypothetical protein
MAKIKRPQTGGSDAYNLATAKNAATIYTGSGTMTRVAASNPNAGQVAYVQFFDVAHGSIVLGTTDPIYQAIIPAGISAANPAVFGVEFHDPDTRPDFDTALSYAVTTTFMGSTPITTEVGLHVGYQVA